MTMAKYRVQIDDGTDVTVEGMLSAQNTVRAAMCWSTLVLSAPYTVDGPEKASAGDTRQAWSAYETQEECDADDDGADAPRITEVR
jgi:hypothetical protein